MSDQSKYSQFITANTIPSTLEEIAHEHIVPVHVKDNEQTISHVEFIESVSEEGRKLFGRGSDPIIRVSHPIKGRIPEARNKPAKDLLPEETTLYYERMAWMTISHHTDPPISVQADPLVSLDTDPGISLDTDPPISVHTDPPVSVQSDPP